MATMMMMIMKKEKTIVSGQSRQLEKRLGGGSGRVAGSVPHPLPTDPPLFVASSDPLLFVCLYVSCSEPQSFWPACYDRTQGEIF